VRSFTITVTYRVWDLQGQSESLNLLAPKGRPIPALGNAQRLKRPIPLSPESSRSSTGRGRAYALLREGMMQPGKSTGPAPLGLEALNHPIFTSRPLAWPEISALCAPWPSKRGG